MKFLLIFSVIYSSFVFSLNNLYWYYQESTRGPVKAKLVNWSELGYKNDTLKTTHAEKKFGT